MQGTDPTATVACFSAFHTGLEAAVVAGLFDPGPVNGRPATRAAYCLRCAVVVEYGGLFSPDEALAPLPDLSVIYADKLSAEWTVESQHDLIRTVAPATLELLEAPG